MWLPGTFFIMTLAMTVPQVFMDQQKSLKKCSKINCLKLDLLRLTSKLANLTQIPLSPGVSLIGTDRTRDIALRLAPHAVSSGSLQHFLRELVTEYINSLNLTFQLKDSALLESVKGFSGTVWTGRSRRRYRWYYIITAASAGFAVLAVLCGKALLASMLALAIAGLLALRTAGFGYAAMAAAANPSNRITQYDIINKPFAYAPIPMHYYDEHHHHHTTGGSKIDYLENGNIYDKDE